MDDREGRIRDEAYRIWVEAGRPDGDEQRHWAEAEKRVRASDDAGEGTSAAKGAAAREAEALVKRRPGKAKADAAGAAPRAALKGKPVDVAAASAAPAKRRTP